MKTLTGLDQKPQLVEEPTDEKVIVLIPTFRTMLKRIAGNCEPKPGSEESIDLYQIGLKLAIEGDVQLEDAEFKLLFEKSKTNPTKFSSHVLGQLLLKFKDAEREADQKRLARN